MKPLYQAVCHIQLNPKVSPAYEVFVSFQIESGQNKGKSEIKILTDLDSNPRIVKHFYAQQIFTQEMGAHLHFIAPSFNLDIRRDQILPGGAGRGGFINVELSDQNISTSNVQCQVFNIL